MRTILCALPFLIHTIVFGLFITNDLISDAIRGNFIGNLCFFFMVLTTIFLVDSEEMRERFILITYKSLVIILNYVFITNLSEVRHPKYWIEALIGGERWKTAFGGIHANFTGYLCLVCIIFTLLAFEIYSKNDLYSVRRGNILILTTLPVIIILLSTGSRSNSISFYMIVIFYLFLKRKVFVGKYKLLLDCFIVIVVIVLAATAVKAEIFSFIWEESNRVENLETNLPVFKEMDAWWTGMGYVSMDGFAEDVFTGYDTWNIDMYYHYIFFATGIVGSIMIFSPMLYMLIKYIMNFIKYGRATTLIIYLVLLFNAYWQVNFFVYRFYASLPIIVYLLTELGVDGEKRNNSR
ncbi:MAG: hypothetical protein R3Y47_00345 [Lachnospiraceae bacterium]